MRGPEARNLELLHNYQSFNRWLMKPLLKYMKRDLDLNGDVAVTTKPSFAVKTIMHGMNHTRNLYGLLIFLVNF